MIPVGAGGNLRKHVDNAPPRDVDKMVLYTYYILSFLSKCSNTLTVTAWDALNLKKPGNVTTLFNQHEDTRSSRSLAKYGQVKPI